MRAFERGVSRGRPLLFLAEEGVTESGGGGEASLVTVGTVVKEWGVSGEVLVQPLTFDPRRFAELRQVVIGREGSAEPGTIEAVSLRKGRLLLKLQGCDTPDDARRFRGAIIKIRRGESPALPEGVYYHYQIEGLEVYTTEGKRLGRVTGIMETGSNDVYVVHDGPQEYLIPAIRDVVTSVDLDAGRMTVRPMESDG